MELDNMPDFSFSRALHANHNAIGSSCSQALHTPQTFYSCHMGYCMCSRDSVFLGVVLLQMGSWVGREPQAVLFLLLLLLPPAFTLHQ